MTYRLSLLAAARSEFDESIAWYEQNQPGLGAVFVGAVQDALDQIIQTPTRFVVADGDVRESTVTGFPFSVYYRVLGSLILVTAIFHHSRSPDIWKQRK